MAEYKKLRKDFTGLKFSRWFVKEFSHTKDRQSYWHCICDCGNKAVVAGTRLKCGKSKSCGCWTIEKTKENNTTHGLSHTKTYWIWYGMISRCTKSDYRHFANYGGRGIKVCERWMDFPSFLQDMGHSSEGMEIERINNNGNYEPSNCRWATRKEQCRNMRNNVMFTYNSQTKLLIEWSEETGISYNCLRYRIKAKWPEKDLFKPSQRC